MIGVLTINVFFIEFAPPAGGVAKSPQVIIPHHPFDGLGDRALQNRPPNMLWFAREATTMADFWCDLGRPRTVTDTGSYFSDSRYLGAG